MKKNSQRIARSGITIAGKRKVIYFLPVTRNYLVSHQWVRELKRGGAREIVGIYFHMNSNELVWAGKYSEHHKQISLGEAIRELEQLSDPLGYEMFVERKIERSEVSKIRRLPQKLGWRYQPHAHGKRPCGCPACLPRGSIKSQKIRAEYDPPPVKIPYEILKERISEETDIDTLLECLWQFQKKRRIADPAFLQRLMTIQNDELLEELAKTLYYFRHKNSKQMLEELHAHSSIDVREFAQESLLKIRSYASNASTTDTTIIGQ